MFQVPERPPALHARNCCEVIDRWRRIRGPFERPCVPRIRSRDCALEVRPQQIADEAADAENLKDDADAYDQVPYSPAPVELISVNPAGHPENARYVHEIESEMEADQKKPKMPLA